MVVILLNILKEQSHQFLVSLWKAKRYIVIYVWSSSIKMGIPVHGNYNKYVWIAMARMEMASDLKTSFKGTAPFPAGSAGSLVDENFRRW